MKKALILPGWYQKPTTNWYPWLKQELESRDYQVFLPDLPTIHTDQPDLAAMMTAIQKVIIPDAETVIIGHSSGCLTGMRLAEIYPLAKLILIAGWDFNDLTAEHQLFWQTPIDHQAIKDHVGEVICIGSDNDPYFTFFTVNDMSKRLGGKSLLIRGAGHFTDEYGVKEIPQVLENL